MSQLPHSDYIAKQLQVGHRSQAIEAHNKHVSAEFRRAEEGAVINLSDLMGAAEEILVDPRCEWSPEQISPTEPER